MFTLPKRSKFLTGLSKSPRFGNIPPCKFLKNGVDTAMKVLLKQDVDNLGYAGEVRTVADGFGRNYLIPKGLALVATAGTMKQAENWRMKAETRRAEQRAEFEALSARIQTVRLVFKARAGESGKLYGSITTAMVADQMNEMLGTEIDRRKVGVEPLRQLGEHNVVVRLSAEFHPEFVVVIENEDETVEVEVAADTAVESTPVESMAAEAEPEVEVETAVEDVADDETDTPE
jgi:large subunit ribosomal protein L9